MLRKAKHFFVASKADAATDSDDATEDGRVGGKEQVHSSAVQFSSTCTSWRKVVRDMPSGFLLSPSFLAPSCDASPVAPPNSYLHHAAAHRYMVLHCSTPRDMKPSIVPLHCSANAACCTSLYMPKTLYLALSVSRSQSPVSDPTSPQAARVIFT